MKYLWVFIFLIFSTVNGQQNLNVNEGVTRYTGSKVGGDSSEINIDDVEGTVYYHDAYRKAILNSKPIFLKYNAYSGSFETQEKRVLLANNGMTISFGTDENWYYVDGKWLLSLDSEIKVYLHPIIIFRPGVEARTAMGDSYPAKFKRQDEYYLQEGKTLKKISKRKSKKLIK